MFIERKILNEIRSYLGKREAIAIKGPRQVGKTSLMKKLAEDLRLKGHKISFLSFEKTKDLEIFSEDISVFAEIHVKGFDYVFIDEFQYAHEGGQQLKYLYDEFEKTQFIISGSSSLELTFKTGKYMVGRLLSFQMNPISFHEYLNFKNPRLFNALKPYLIPINQNHIKLDISNILLKEINQILEDYLIFGGYPRVILSKSQIEKTKILSSIFDNYILREISSLLALSQKEEFIKLIKLLAVQIGNLISYQELSSSSNLNRQALIQDIHILKETFILDLINPYSRNKRTELVKTPKVYFCDLGFRNYVLSNFQNIFTRVDKGALFENYIFLTLKTYQNEFSQSHFWRTKSGAEVDFVIEKDGEIIPVEVKYSSFNEPIVGKSLFSFIEKFSPKRAFIFTKDYLNLRKVKDCEVYFVPACLIIC